MANKNENSSYLFEGEILCYLTKYCVRISFNYNINDSLGSHIEYRIDEMWH